jgi:baculoviral IAP repeat-containing protein 6 (apollon)
MDEKHKQMYSGTNQQRSKRLALEITTLSTALPLSYSSSVYLRCDTDRIDLMKVIF